MAEKRHNLVTFSVDEGPTVFLKLEGPFVLRGGVTPTENRAIVPSGEFEKLRSGGTFRDTGTINFFYSNLETPDHSIRGVRIYDVEPVSSGRVKGEAVARVDELRLFLCDFRERFVPPRGGLLTHGEMNNAKLAPADLKKNSELVAMVMQAMGIPPDSFNSPSLLDRLGPPRNLNWSGTPAGPELAKLLAHGHGVLCPQSNGSVIIEAAGTGIEPDFRSMEELPRFSLPGLGRRGKTIILTSAPHAVIDTVRVGPSATTWEYVAQDFIQDNSETGVVKWQKVWRPLALVSRYGNLSAQQALKEDFKNAAFFRDSLREDTYRCIRVKAPLAKQGVGGVLRLAPDELGDWAAPEVMAKIAVQQDSGFWINSPDFVRVPVVSIEVDPRNQEYILRCRDLLGRAGTKDNDGFRSLRHQFTPLTADQIKVRFTREVIDKDGRRESFTIGFRQTPEKVEELKPQELAAAIATADNDTVFVQVPELRLRRIEGKDQNRDGADGVVAKARAIAEAYLAGSGEPYEVRTVKGFVAGELSGRVCEIAWDAEKLTTTFKVNGWHYPLTASGDRQILKEFQEGLRKEHATASERMESGGASVNQPNVPVEAIVRPSPDRAFVCQVTAKGSTSGLSGGKYIGKFIGRNSTAKTAGNLAMPEGMRVASSDDTCLLLNPEEDGKPTHILTIGSYVAAVESGQTEGGLPILTIISTTYRDAEPSTLADAQAWNRGVVSSGNVLGDVPVFVELVQAVYWDTVNGILRQKRRTGLIDAGGKFSFVTSVTDEVVDTAEDCS